MDDVPIRLRFEVRELPAAQLADADSTVCR